MSRNITDHLDHRLKNLRFKANIAHISRCFAGRHPRILFSGSLPAFFFPAATTATNCSKILINSVFREWWQQLFRGFWGSCCHHSFYSVAIHCISIKYIYSNRKREKELPDDTNRLSDIVYKKGACVFESREGRKRQFHQVVTKVSLRENFSSVKAKLQLRLHETIPGFVPCAGSARKSHCFYRQCERMIRLFASKTKEKQGKVVAADLFQILEILLPPPRETPCQQVVTWVNGGSGSRKEKRRRGLENYRRLTIGYEYLAETTGAMIHLAL